MPKQLYIPLPCAAARHQMIDRQLGRSLTPIPMVTLFAMVEVSCPHSLQPFSQQLPTHIHKHNSSSYFSWYSGADAACLKLHISVLWQALRHSLNNIKAIVKQASGPGFNYVAVMGRRVLLQLSARESLRNSVFTDRRQGLQNITAGVE